jgi:chorismate mutase-like protein
MKLEDLRRQIDALDQQIVALLNSRAHVACDIGQLKKANDLPVFDAKREQQVFEKIHKLNDGPLANEDLDDLYKVLIKACRKLEKE